VKPDGLRKKLNTMPRYVAFLRGVSPSNAKMSALKRSFELAGFRNVTTVLSSGNVVFDAGSASEAVLDAVAPNAKRVVSFMRAAPSTLPKLPVEADEARVLCLVGREVYTTYVPSPQGPVFMKLLQQSFGKDITTRTWDTVKKCAAA
jgi:uncharacterized protein (DUF1697 family)